MPAKLGPVATRYYIGNFSLPRPAALAARRYCRAHHLSLSGWMRSLALRELGALDLLPARLVAPRVNRTPARMRASVPKKRA